jgi:hypothetical protein
MVGELGGGIMQDKHTEKGVGFCKAICISDQYVL